jgi:hypothetical protein
LYHQAAILCIDGSNDLHLLVGDDKVFVYLINKDAKCFNKQIPSGVSFKGQTFIAAPINLKDNAAGMDDFKSV